MFDKKYILLKLGDPDNENDVAQVMDYILASSKELDEIINHISRKAQEANIFD